MEKEERIFVQIVKYGLIGVLNTLLTAIVIWCILFIFSGKDQNNVPSTGLMLTANISGYIVGVINSFILNRNWTFKSSTDWRTGFMRFLIAFGICYLVQLGAVLWLNSLDVNLEWSVKSGRYSFTISWAYLCQLIGIVIYSILNFLLNKYYAFRVNSDI